MKIKSITTLALALVMGLGASAQTDSPWYVQGSLGPSYSIGGGAGIGEMLSPAGQIAVGKQFMPQIGARLAFGGWRGRYHNDLSGLNSGFYHWQASIDGLWNISQTVALDPDRRVDFNLIFGAGFDRAFKNGGVSSFLGRLGLGTAVKLTPALDFNVEAIVNGVSDRWNTRDDHAFDSYLNLLVGVTWKFGTGFKCAGCETVSYDNDAVNEMRREYVEVVKEVHDTVRVEVPVAAPAPVKRGITTHVHFLINQTTVRPDQQMNVEAVATYLKNNPDARCIVAGYADKGTGTVAINTRLAEERANSVAAMLEDTYGISRSRITTKSMGDEEFQPFSVNDWNRVVIITAD